MSVICTIEGAGGGGGCFTADTKITLGHGGVKPISKINVGDDVVCFHNNSLFVRRVLEVHQHETTITEDELVRISWDGGSLDITTRHLVYRDLNTFHEVQQLIVGDILWDVDNNQHVITNIEPIDAPTIVYTLTISEYPTFIANGIKVHNKGGSKSADSTGGVEAPNTLFSTQTIRVLNAISEGVISNVSEVYFDDTPIVNYTGCTYQWRNGSAAQTYIQGFSDIEEELPVGIQITTSTPTSNAVTSLAIDACRVTLQVDSLFTVDTSNGNTNGRSVSMSISTRPNNTGIWTQQVIVTFSGKTMNPYDREIYIPAPSGAGLWEIKVTRLSPDDSLSTVGSNTRWVSFTEIQSVQLTYPNTALVGIVANAEATGGKIPVTSFDVDGIMIYVPDNYNPVTRTYTGTWDGGFSTSPVFSNNSAWVLYDLLTNPRYGLGHRVSAANIDKYSFYRAGQYCDVMVSDGKGGTEPRFQFNGAMIVQDTAIKVLQNVASNMRAYLLEIGGIITLIQDRPTNTSYLLTNNDIIDGQFEYQSTNVRNRHTTVNTSFNDPSDRYLLTTVSEGDTTGLNRYGFNPTDEVAVGCTSEAQARRQARATLYSELSLLETVKFKVGLRNCFMIPGDVIEIQDQDLAEVKYNGVVTSSSTTSVTVATPITLDNETYSITIQDVTQDTNVYSDTYGKYMLESKPITQTNGAYSTFTPTSAFTSAPAINSSILLQAGVVPVPFKVTAVTETATNVFEIIAVQYDPNKWIAIEDGITLATPIYNVIAGYSNNPPTNLQYNEEPYTTPTSTSNQLMVSWTPPTDQNSVVGTATAGSTTTITIVASGSANTDGYYNGWSCLITAGAGIGLTGYVSAYNSTTKVITFTSTLATALNSTSQYVLTSPTSLKSTYTVRWTRDNLPMTLIDNVSDTHVYLLNVIPGIYTFYITATNIRGVTSSALTGTYNYHTNTGSTLQSVTNLIAVGGSGTTFSTQNLTIGWTNPTANQTLTSGVTTPVNDYLIEIWDAAGINKKATYDVVGTLVPETFTNTAISGTTTSMVLPSSASIYDDYYKNWTLSITSGGGSGQTALITGYTASTNTIYFAALGASPTSTSVFTLTADTNTINSGGQFVYTFQQNQIDFGTPTRSFEVKIYARDTLLRVAIATSAVFNNPAPAIVSLTSNSTVGQIMVAISNATDADVTGYQVWSSTTTGFTPGSGNLIYDGPNTQVIQNVAGGATYYYKAAAYDSFGKSGLNISSQISATALSQSAVAWLLQGLTFQQNNPTTNSISWTAGTIVQQTGTTSTSYSITAGNAAWTSGKLYVYFAGSGTTLSTTTVLATAVSSGGYIIGVYNGGTDWSFDNGKAFVDGSSILAGTVGANQLITGSAVITGSAQIQAATIDTLQLKNGSVVKILSVVNNTALTQVSPNTTTTILTPSFQCPSPSGIAGPFTTIVDAICYQKVYLNTNGYYLGYYTQIVELLESTDGGATFPNEATYFMTSDGSWDQGPLPGITAAGSYLQDAKAFKLYYLLYPGRYYKIQYTYDTYSVSFNTYSTQQSYYYGGVTATVMISLAG